MKQTLLLFFAGVAPLGPFNPRLDFLDLKRLLCWETKRQLVYNKSCSLICSIVIFENGWILYGQRHVHNLHWEARPLLILPPSIIHGIILRMIPHCFPPSQNLLASINGTWCQLSMQIFYALYYLF